MAAKQTNFPGVYLDWDMQGDRRSDVTLAQWEDGVVATLRELSVAPCAASQAVLQALRGANITIIPARQPLMPDKSDANAFAHPVSPEAATRPGGKPEGGQAGAGIGGGSDVVLHFVAQDWAASSASAPLTARDETLLHELVHALRQVKGIEDSIPLQAPFEVLRRGDGTVAQLMSGTAPSRPTKHSQIYNEYEEFVAIVITNIYRSENRRPGLRRDHLGGNAELAYPMTNARNFLTVWRPQIERFCSELRAVCNRLAVVDCHFNPVFELYVAQNRFLPGGRQIARR